MLEELVDVLHFALCVHLEMNDKTFYGSTIQLFANMPNSQVEPIIERIITNHEMTLYYTIALAYALGFTFDDLYNGYCAKNKINYQRQESGY